jgi:hypothetical protein
MTKMETLIITTLLLTIIVASTLTIIDISRQNEMKKQAKLNLSFMVFYLPILGPVLYYSILRKKYCS